MPRTDAWVCPKCQTANMIGTRFCRGCGQQVGCDCPSCNALMEAAAPFCSHCGANFSAALAAQQQRKEEADLARSVEEQRRKVELQRLQVEAVQLESMKKSAESAAKWQKIGSVVGLVGVPLAVIFPIAILMWLYSLVKASQVIRAVRVTGDEIYLRIAKKAFWWSAIPLAVGGVFVGAIIIFIVYTFFASLAR
ncbi:MAG: zinc ribbon domain-containing protein [Roseiflexaceae bacterium]|nr:zinc ribbon domain-containing protein [Roseiflexaceae bacterium]